MNTNAFKKLPDTSALRKIAHQTHETAQYLYGRLSYYSGSLRDPNHLDQLRAMIKRLSEQPDYTSLIQDAHKETLKSSQIELREIIISRNRHGQQCFEGLRHLLLRFTE